VACLDDDMLRILDPSHRFHKFINNEFNRYIVAGGIAFGVDFSALVFFKETLNIHYLWASGWAFILGAITAYILNIKWVFSIRRFNRKRVEFSLFLLIGVIGLLLNQLGMYLFVSFFAVNYVMAKIFTTIIVFLVNFISRKLILFSV
jgi:putative flippase GtrA